MAKFITQLIADSLIRLNDKPFFVKGETKSIILEFPDFVAAVFDRFASLSELFVPTGLIINVEVEAKDINEAIDISENYATYALSLLSCSSVASVSPPKPLWAYESSFNKQKRDYILFIYDPVLVAVNKRKFNQSALFEILEKKVNGFMKRKDINKDRKNRMLRAIASFRRGLSDNNDIMTEFLILWSALETLDIVYREVFGIKAEKFYAKCSSCGKEYNNCPECGKRDIFLKGITLSGLEEIFTILGQSEKFHLLRRLRHGIMHGFEELEKSIKTVDENLALVRKAVLLMIMRILSVDKKIEEKILESPPYKGKFIPYFKLLFNGKFDPRNAKDPFGHPSVEVKYSKIETLINGDKLTLKPTWEFTPRNVENMTLLGYEIYGEEVGQLEIEKFDIK